MNLPQIKKKNNFGDSLTKPEQTIPMRELVQRYANGMPLHKNETMVWESDGEHFEGIDARRLDFVDIQQRKLAAEERIKEGNAHIQDVKNRKRAAELAALEAANKLVSQSGTVIGSEGEPKKP